MKQAYQYGVYTRELLQFGDKLSMLLLLPPSEDFSSNYWPLVGTKEPGLTMPLQIFELGGWSNMAVHVYGISLSLSIVAEIYGTKVNNLR